MLLNCFAVGAGGFVGSILRYLIGLLPFLHKGAIPFQTLLVNLLGAVLIGVIAKNAELYGEINEQTLLFLKVGVCGGFTTFSTFALESASMIDEGRPLLMLSYMTATHSTAPVSYTHLTLPTKLEV